MIFSILTPVPPRTCVPLFWGGSKLLCVLWPLCVYLDLGPEELFSCIWTPEPMAGVPGPNSGYPQPPPPPPHMAPSEDLAVFTLGKVFSDT